MTADDICKVLLAREDARAYPEAGEQPASGYSCCAAGPERQNRGRYGHARTMAARGVKLKPACRGALDSGNLPSLRLS
jgi:hypothetical protein